MKAYEALEQYFNGFMTAYPDTAVPDNATFPYMTYQKTLGKFGDEPVSCLINIWHKTSSELLMDNYSYYFREYIEENDVIECEDGYIWIIPDEPFSQAIRINEDNGIKRRYINIRIDYNTI